MSFHVHVHLHTVRRWQEETVVEPLNRDIDDESIRRLIKLPFDRKLYQHIRGRHLDSGIDDVINVRGKAIFVGGRREGEPLDNEIPTQDTGSEKEEGTEADLVDPEVIIKQLSDARVRKLPEQDVHAHVIVIYSCCADDGHVEL